LAAARTVSIDLAGHLPLHPGEDLVPIQPFVIRDPGVVAGRNKGAGIILEAGIVAQTLFEQGLIHLEFALLLFALDERGGQHFLHHFARDALLLKLEVGGLLAAPG
jgi:hypothetical protein